MGCIFSYATMGFYEVNECGSAYRRRIILPFLYTVASDGIQCRDSPRIGCESSSKSESPPTILRRRGRRQTVAISWRRNEPEQGRVVPRRLLRTEPELVHSIAGAIGKGHGEFLQYYTTISHRVSSSHFTGPQKAGRFAEAQAGERQRATAARVRKMAGFGCSKHSQYTEN